MNHLVDARTVSGECACNGGKSTGFVLQNCADKIFAFDIVHGLYGKFLVACTAYSSAAVIGNISAYVYNVTHYGTGCGKLACASAVEHGISERIAVNKYGVK